MAKIYTLFSSKNCTQSTYRVLTYIEFFFSVESNPGYHWFRFTTLYDWSRKLAPPSRPIRCKTKSNLNLVTCVFARLRPSKCIYFEFSLAPCELYLCSDWPLLLLTVSVLRHSKSAQYFVLGLFLSFQSSRFIFVYSIFFLNQLLN